MAGGPLSLRLRLTAAALVWVVAGLAVAGALLVFLFQRHIESRFDNQLQDHMHELVAAARLGPKGRLTLSWRPADPRFNRPHSGWYWQVRAPDGDLAATARSARTDRLAIPGRAPDDGAVRALAGPGGRDLRAWVRAIRLPGAKQRYTFLVAGPRADIRRQVYTFSGSAAAVLGVLGLLLVAGVAAQVAFGLRPLARVRRAVAAVRAGRAKRLAGAYPPEVAALVAELNALLDHNADLLARARAQAGDMAHALKTPLAALRNEADALPDPQGAAIRRRLDALTGVVERQLARARAAGGDVLGAVAPVRPVVDDLRFTLETLYGDRAPAFVIDVPENAAFRGDAQDLEEMLGTFLDNACKWAAGTAWVTAAVADGRLHLTVADDGPGIPADRRDAVLARGGRLDEAAAGSGLGLAISRDVAALYGGRLTLGDGAAGGLAATLDLPAAV